MPMKTIHEVNGKFLSYEQFGIFKTRWELRLGSDFFATLRILGFNSLKRVRAESGIGIWTIIKKGAFNPVIFVKETVSDTTLALFNCNEKLMQFPNGHQYRWSAKNKLPFEWPGGLEFKFDKGSEYINYIGRWTNEKEIEVIRLSMKSVPDRELFFRMMQMKEGLQIDIAAEALSLIAKKELTLATILGWYLIVESQSRS